MDGEDLIICVAFLIIQKLWPPLICDDLRVRCIASRNGLRFTSLLEPIFEDLGGPNGPRNSIFEPFFSILFWNVFSHRILIDFRRLQTRKIAILLWENHDFCNICVFDQSTKKARFWVFFRRPKRGKFDEKSSLNMCCFPTSDFKGFFFDFDSILELLFKWILKPLDLDFGRFSDFQNLFFGSRSEFGETCVKRFRLKDLLWWLGRRGADQ